MPNIWLCGVLALLMFRILHGVSVADSSDVPEVSNQQKTHMDNIVQNKFSSEKDKHNGHLQSRTTDSLTYIGKHSVNQNGFISKKLLTQQTNRKSLVFIFDECTSLLDDLEQLKLAASLIVNQFSQQEDTSIYNYIFVSLRNAGQFLAGFQKFFFSPVVYSL